MYLRLNLAPFVPLSKQGIKVPRNPLFEEGEVFLKGGEAPLFYLHPLPLLREGGRGIGLSGSMLRQA
jgi:hypothetical protein